MKRGIVMLLLGLTVSARAEWRDVRLGGDRVSVLRWLGAPLLANKSRDGSTETWTYDRGGYIRFENGRVIFWRASQR